MEREYNKIMRMPETPPDITKMIDDIAATNPQLLLSSLNKLSPLDSHGKYRHWDKLKYLELPSGMKSHKIWWALIKLARKNSYKELGIKGIYGKKFKFNIVDHFQVDLHYLDQYASGNISVDKPILSPQFKNTYLVSSLIEEAINSSQLEGATTTRDIAKKMIKEGRNPRDTSETMILNNYKAINYIRTLKNEKLTPELINEIHKVISKGTLEKANKAGNYRNDEDDIHVIVDNDQVVFTPPNYKEIKKRIIDLCNFANNDDYSGFFIHPVIKAIIIHFIFAYIHPYVDGNGRTARALFYWFMLKKGYWLTEFISISKILKKSPAKYALSYLYTETDENDLSYFIDYQLNVIKQAIDELNKYIEKKMRDLEDTESLIRNTDLAEKLNIRQLTLLKNAIKVPGKIYSITEHKNSHRIAYETARKDLIELSDGYNLFIKVKSGRSFVFIVPSDIKDRIK